MSRKKTYEVQMRTHDYFGVQHEYFQICDTYAEANATLDRLQAQVEAKGEVIDMQGIWINKTGEDTQ